MINLTKSENTMNEKKKNLDDEEVEESTETESSNSENVYEIISRGKGIIPNVNIEEINEGDVDDKRHDNIGGGDDDYVEESKMSPNDFSCD